tara:strand:- start:429 stop:1082 length:654 start_codon:yes stop_codon:yes gene_type:complete
MQNTTGLPAHIHSRISGGCIAVEPVEPEASGGAAAAPVKTVDYETFQRVVAAKNNLEGQVSQLRAERDGALEKAATVDSVVQDRDTWKQKAEQEGSRFERFQQISSVTGNATSEAVELVEYAYGRLPEADRPALPQWLEGIKADPSGAPLALQPIFGQAAAPPKQQRPKAGPVSTMPPGAAPEVTSEKILAIRQRAQETGDWSEYSDLRQQMGFVRR